MTHQHHERLLLFTLAWIMGLSLDMHLALSPSAADETNIFFSSLPNLRALLTR